MIMLALLFIYALTINPPPLGHQDADNSTSDIKGSKVSDISEEQFKGNMMPPEEYEEYEEDYYDGTFYEYPCAERSPRIPCFEEID
jgi:hypothetical protein